MPPMQLVAWYSRVKNMLTVEKKRINGRVLIALVISISFYILISNLVITLPPVFRFILWLLTPLKLPYWNVSFTLTRFELEVIDIFYCIFALGLFYFFAKIHPRELGFKLPENKKSLFFWIRSALIFSCLLFLSHVIWVNMLSLFGYPTELEFYTFNEIPWSRRLGSAIITSPIIEETFFRGIICSVLAIFIGWRTKTIILISGALFALAHFFYGNPSPMSFIAGYFLAWSFCVSRSLITPWLFHVLANVSYFSLDFIELYHPNFLNKLIAIFTINF